MQTGHKDNAAIIGKQVAQQLILQARVKLSKNSKANGKIMPGNLNHLKVLLTRQASTVDDLQAQIAALGGSSINLPLFAIESLLDQQLVAALQIKFKRGALALCISRNAAQIVLPHLSQPNAVTWAAIGPSTAQYLQQQGVAKVLFPPSRFLMTARR